MPFRTLLVMLALTAGVAFGQEAPDASRFVVTVLDQNLNEPIEMVWLPGGRILFVERAGAVKLYDPATAATRTIATINVAHQLEDGLIGVALDPDYARNHWVYFFYSPPGDEARQHVSRFALHGDHLDLASEKVVLVIENQRDQCCHSGGSLAFGPDGNLYIGVGDNTNPFAADGYGPIDQRQGDRLCADNEDVDACSRSAWDAQRTSGNTNDLRGKILRIHPEPDGTYTIPEGNLFAPGTPGTRPEIYVMGNRNPYRVAIDPRTGYLYWGDVGPDAGEDHPQRGPRGYDEINQARQAGYFGWPYFVGDNKAYHDFDFTTGTPGAPFNPAAPINDSPNNTGLKQLPPAQPAFIWYPYGPSEAFPLVGEGGRTAMAGPVYYYDDYADQPNKFPRYYDGKLFIYEWMRGWIMTVTMDDEGDYAGMERFMPGTRFSNPADMLFAPDGTLYLLEYGTSWNTQNLDARLVHIRYNPGNRAPVAAIEADVAVGAAPLAVHLTSTGTHDDDEDRLTYAWDLGGGNTVAGPDIRHTFTTPGVHRVVLTVADPHGATDRATLDVLVGNAPPRVALRLDGNTTFYGDGRPLHYTATVSDAEDGSLADGTIPVERVAVTVDYLKRGWDRIVAAQGHAAALVAAREAVGKALIDGSDCLACHQVDAPSIGPSFTDVAERYRSDGSAVGYLVEKIIKGGGGVWGEQAMAAHPQLSLDEAEQMVRYILALGAPEAAPARLPTAGTFVPRAHQADSTRGRYLLQASYTDNGANGIAPMTGRALVQLRHPRVEAETMDGGDAEVFSVPAGLPGFDQPADVVLGLAGRHLMFEGLDLTGVRALTAQVGLTPEQTAGGRIEVRRDARDGPLLGVIHVDQQPGMAGMHQFGAALQPSTGRHDVYFVFQTDGFVFQTDGDAAAMVGGVDWVRFRLE